MIEQNKPDEWREAGKELAKMADDVTDPKPDEPMQKAEWEQAVLNDLNDSFASILCHCHKYHVADLVDIQGVIDDRISPHVRSAITQAKEEERKRIEGLARGVMCGAEEGWTEPACDNSCCDRILSAIRNEE